jgi:hypothetical protein
MASSYCSDENDGEEQGYNYTFSGDTESSSVSSNQSNIENRGRQNKFEVKDKKHRESHSSSQQWSRTKESRHGENRKHRNSSDNLTTQSHRNSNRSSCASHHSAQSGQTKSSAFDEEDKHEIALFGAHGLTGHHFLQFALEAGYHIRALIPPGITLTDMQGNDNLKVITGTLNESNKVRQVVKKASYVVCMLGDCEQTLHHPPRANDGLAPTSTLGFVTMLFPLLEEYNRCRVLLYQVRFPMSFTSRIPCGNPFLDRSL